MKKDITMKKSSFINGAMVMSLAIIISKVLGIVYVIPFHQIIGDKGGALYGYAYTIYLFFISISTAGVPLAISKIVAEYNALGYYNVKRRVFIIGKRIAFLLGFICFILIMMFAPIMAKFILGDVVGGNSINDVIFVIRVIGSAILVVPILSIYRGYFEGHRFMSPPSISQVLEQLVRIIIIVLGSFLLIDVFNANITSAVGVALFGACVGALTSYFYLLNKYLKNRRKFNERVRSVNEPIVSDKQIVEKLIFYAIPFIMIDVFRSLYNYIDMFTVVKGLVDISQFSAGDAETVYSVLSTWGQKFNMIILAVASGIVVSLVPNLTESIVKKNNDDINVKITQSLSALMFFTIPMTFGISFLSKPIWILFYGKSVYGPNILRYYIFVGLVTSIFTCLVTIIHTFKNYRGLLVCLLSGVLFKFVLNMSLLRTFYNVGLPPYYGVITATIIGFMVSIIIASIILSITYKIRFEKIIKNFVDIVCGSTLMVMFLLLIHFFIPLSSDIRIANLLIIIVYSLVGATIYFLYSHFTNLSATVFGKNNLLKNIRKIFIHK